MTPPEAALMAELRFIVDRASLPQALDYERAARELSVSVSQLRKLIRRGEIATVLIGRRAKVPASEVRRLTAVGAARALKQEPLRSRPGRYDAKAEAEKVRALARRRTH